MNDINKINIAIKNNYSIIHLLQDDVLKNKNNWENKLYDIIISYKNPLINIINNNNIYIKHLKELNDNNIKFILN